MKKPNQHTMGRCEIRDALLAIVSRCAVIDAQWRMLRSRGLTTVPLTKPVRLTVGMLARRAEHNCGVLADRAITGLAAMDAGNCKAGELAVAACLSMIGFDQAADRAAARMLRESKQEKCRDQH